jgi:hypothetical protein
MSFLLQVFLNKEASAVKNAVLPGCSSLSALTYNSPADVLKKIITLRPFVVSGSVNSRWKDEKLLYVCTVYS